MICGSLRKGSFNRALMNALPALAPADMKLTEALDGPRRKGAAHDPGRAVPVGIRRGWRPSGYQSGLTGPERKAELSARNTALDKFRTAPLRRAPTFYPRGKRGQPRCPYVGPGNEPTQDCKLVGTPGALRSLRLDRRDLLSHCRSDNAELRATTSFRSPLTNRDDP